MLKFNTYKPLPDNVTVDDSFIHGLGLICSKDINAGVCLGITHILHDQRGWIRTPLGGFINHSEHPNCFILDTGKERNLYPVKPIRKAEELCVFYTLNDEFSK